MSDVADITSKGGWIADLRELQRNPNSKAALLNVNAAKASPRIFIVDGLCQIAQRDLGGCKRHAKAIYCLVKLDDLLRLP
jgi:hypothetical protein